MRSNASMHLLESSPADSWSTGTSAKAWSNAYTW
jgi:hypothetical protein